MKNFIITLFVYGTIMDASAQSFLEQKAGEYRSESPRDSAQIWSPYNGNDSKQQQTTTSAQGGTYLDPGSGLSTQSYNGVRPVPTSSTNSDGLTKQAESFQNISNEPYNGAIESYNKKVEQVKQRTQIMDASNRQTISSEVTGVRNAIVANREIKEKVKNTNTLSSTHQKNMEYMRKNSNDVDMDRDLWNNAGQSFGHVDGQDPVKKGNNADRNPYRGRVMNGTQADIDINAARAKEWDELHSQGNNGNNAGENSKSNSTESLGWQNNNAGKDITSAFYQKAGQYNQQQNGKNSNPSIDANKNNTGDAVGNAPGSSSNIAASTNGGVNSSQAGYSGTAPTNNNSIDNNAQQAVQKNSDLVDIYVNGHRETIDKHNMPLNYGVSYTTIDNQTTDEQENIKATAERNNVPYYIVHVKGNDGNETTYVTLDANSANEIRQAVENKEQIKTGMSMKQVDGPANATGQLIAASENPTELPQNGTISGAKRVIPTPPTYQTVSTGATANVETKLPSPKPATPVPTVNPTPNGNLQSKVPPTIPANGSNSNLNKSLGDGKN